MNIPDKSTYLKLAAAGLLGNTLRTWGTVDEALAAGARRLTIRGKERASKFFVPSLFAHEAHSVLHKLMARGAKPENLFVQEVPHLPGCMNRACDGCGRVMNGEVMRTERYIHLVYGTAQLNLRTDILDNGIAIEMLTAVNRIKWADQECWDMLNDIWMAFPDTVIEFSVFAMPVGLFQQNTVVWEVRSF